MLDHLINACFLARAGRQRASIIKLSALRQLQPAVIRACPKCVP